MVLRIDLELRNAHIFILGEVTEFVVTLKALKEVGGRNYKYYYGIIVL